MKFSVSALSWIILLVGGNFVHSFCPTSSFHRTVSRTAAAGADIEQETEKPVPNTDESDSVVSRGKVNEIDFCIAPADVSLSRSYGVNDKTLSLTRALNNASNRAVRRILLARSWPSAEALNLSLCQVLAEKSSGKISTDSTQRTSKCPVPRPILNILVRRGGEGKADTPVPRGRTDEEYVADQIKAFKDRYTDIPGFSVAEAYLECILSLATSGVESPRVSEVMDAGVYDESYRRVVAVLQSVGAVFEQVPDSKDEQLRIAQKLVDKDICLSMMDKITMKQDVQSVVSTTIAETDEESKTTEKKNDIKPTKAKDDKSTKTKSTKDDDVKDPEKEDAKFRLKFWRKADEAEEKSGKDTSDDENEDEEFILSRNDLGGVLLSAEEPSMTRQLNVLSNIVQRALLFGGDQELLVLSETLEADKPAFVQRWYPGTNGEVDIYSPKEETRPGVQYLNCLVDLLKECYSNGVVSNLDAPLPLIASYNNAYERLTASLVELGSGYIKPASDVMTMPIPRTAQEELGRFAVWESTFRSRNKPDVTAYPEDLEGSWQVKDEIGGETIGISTVVFKTQGEVEVAPPMKGLRWRLDPGPAHLDTCTFQVLGQDGTVLQYRGFVDRGARLEARFSKRSIRIRGSVMFQMRDGDSAYLGDDYWKDMLPINYRTGTTKFVMSKEK